MKTAFGTLEQSDVVSSVASQTRKGKVDSSWAKYSCQIKKKDSITPLSELRG